MDFRRSSHPQWPWVFTHSLNASRGSGTQGRAAADKKTRTDRTSNWSAEPADAGSEYSTGRSSAWGVSSGTTTESESGDTGPMSGGGPRSDSQVDVFDEWRSDSRVVISKERHSDSRVGVSKERHSDSLVGESKEKRPDSRVGVFKERRSDSLVGVSKERHSDSLVSVFKERYSDSRTDVFDDRYSDSRAGDFDEWRPDSRVGVFDEWRSDGRVGEQKSLPVCPAGDHRRPSVARRVTYRPTTEPPHPLSFVHQEHREAVYASPRNVEKIVCSGLPSKAVRTRQVLALYGANSSMPYKTEKVKRWEMNRVNRIMINKILTAKSTIPKGPRAASFVDHKHWR